MRQDAHQPGISAAAQDAATTVKERSPITVAGDQRMLADGLISVEGTALQAPPDNFVRSS